MREFHAAPVARLLGMKLSFPEPGMARVDLPYNRRLNHPLGGVHGGIIATLADVAGWYASSARRDGQRVATVEYRIHLLEPVARRALRAEGRVLRAGRRIDVCEMRVFDDAGRAVAAATGTFVPVDGAPGTARAHRKTGR